MGQPTSDRRSRLVLGTVDLPDTAVAPPLLDRFYDAGCRRLDVANVYLDGDSARAVGRWLRARSSPGVVLYAKGCHPPYCSADLVGAEVDRARQLLDVDRIDVFVLHRDDTAVPAGAFADALLAEVETGRIGAFGVSNWTLARAGELRSYLEEAAAAHRLVAFSNQFSLAEMVSAPWPGCLAATKDEIRELGAMGLELLAWSSLAIGYFAGRESPSFSSGVNEARRARARELGAQLGASATAIALAYVLHQPDHVLPALGTRSLAHLDEALAAAALELTPEQAGWLENG
jgi:aryl-alcohol dehydrogenase-like predicted oxidoreductase